MRVNRLLAFTAALGLVAAVGAAAVVRAQAPAARMGHAFGFHGVMGLRYLGRQINLTTAQKQQIKDIVKVHKDDIKALVDQGFAARKSLQQAIAAGNNDAIASAAQQLSAVQVKGAQLRALLRAKIYSDVLQPDQRAKADQILAQFEQKADQRRQRIDQAIERLLGSAH